MKIIGITGGIGSGKSTVAHFLEEKGYPVVDADLISRKIVKPGSRVLAELVAHFGNGILYTDGALNRDALAKLAFSDISQKEILDHITHKAILETISKEIKKTQKQLNPNIIFVDAALLIETGLYRQMDEVWVVTAPEELKIQRVVTRDRLETYKIKQRIQMQLSDDEKIQYASRIINNTGTKSNLFDTLEKLMRDYETV